MCKPATWKPHFPCFIAAFSEHFLCQLSGLQQSGRPASTSTRDKRAEGVGQRKGIQECTHSQRPLSLEEGSWDILWRLFWLLYLRSPSLKMKSHQNMHDKIHLGIYIATQQNSAQKNRAPTISTEDPRNKIPGQHSELLSYRSCTTRDLTMTLDKNMRQTRCQLKIPLPSATSTHV